MMSKKLSGVKIAALVANGFDEKPFLKVQKMMIEMGADIKIISSNQGLVNGWEGTSWGHNYAVDAQLNTALGADYDAIIVPSGQRSHDKLKQTAHTARFIGSFVTSEKPVCVMGDAKNLMSEIDMMHDMSVDHVMSGDVDEDHIDQYLSTMAELLMHNDDDVAEAA